MTYPPQPGPQGQPGQPGQFGQPYPPAGFGAPAQPKKKTGLIVGLVAGLVVLVGGGIALFLLLGNGGGSDEDQVNELADDLVTATNEQDTDLAMSIMCEGMADQVTQMMQMGQNLPSDMNVEVPTVKASRGGDITIEGDTAKIPISLSAESGASPGGSGEVKVIFTAKKEDDWCINGSELDPSSMPKMPSMPDMPDMPDMPEIPDMPDIPEMPDMPDMPAIPEMPDMPEMPGMGTP